MHCQEPQTIINKRILFLRRIKICVTNVTKQIKQDASYRIWLLQKSFASEKKPSGGPNTLYKRGPGKG